MKRMTQLMTVSLFFVLTLDAQAQQRKKQWAPQPEISPLQQTTKQPTTNQPDQKADQPRLNTEEPVQQEKAAPVQKPPENKVAPTEGITEERRKERDELEERILKGGLSVSLSSYDRRFAQAMTTAIAVVRFKKIAELRLALRAESIKKERIQEAIETCRRMLAEFNAKGGNAFFSSSDRSLLKVYLIGDNAADVIENAASPALIERMKKEYITEAIDTSKRALAEFNEKGGQGSVGSPDERIIDISYTALVAADIIQKAQSSKFTTNMKREIVEQAVEASKRVLAEFNEKGWNAYFDTQGNLQAMRSFQDARGVFKKP